MKYEELFQSETQKAEAFDKLAKAYYMQNFGAAGKAEVDLLMFSIYMDALIKRYSADGVLDYKACSDYNIGKQLGITQEKVRNLKLKKQARYREEFDWTKSLVAVQNSIRYDEQKHKIIIPMPDPNLYNEIRNFVEQNDGYIELQRGGNVLQMRPEYFFYLAYLSSENEQDKETLRERLAKKLREINESNCIDEIKTDREVAEHIVELNSEYFDAIESMLDGIDNPIATVFKGIRTIRHIIKNNRSEK